MISDERPRSWSVIVVPFPYSERLAEKRRPAVVVSSDRLHEEGYLWIAMITGAGKELRAGDVPIRDLRRAGLPGASMVRTAKLATIEPIRVIRTIGLLPEAERRVIQREVESFLAK